MKIFRKFIRLIIISLAIFSLLETSLFSSVTLVQAVGERCGGAWDWECAQCPDGSRKKGCQHTVAEDGSCSGPESCDDCPACGEPPAQKPSCNRREYNECIPGQPGFSRHVIQKEDCNFEVTVESQRDPACGVPPENPPPPPERCSNGRSVGETFTMCEKIGKSRQWKMNEQCQEVETGVMVDDPSCKLGQMPPPQEPKKDSLPPQQRQRERIQQIGISDCYSRPINQPYLEGDQCFQCDDVNSQPSAIELSKCTTGSYPCRNPCNSAQLFASGGTVTCNWEGKLNCENRTRSFTRVTYRCDSGILIRSDEKEWFEILPWNDKSCEKPTPSPSPVPTLTCTLPDGQKISPGQMATVEEKTLLGECKIHIQKNIYRCDTRGVSQLVRGEEPRTTWISGCSYLICSGPGVVRLGEGSRESVEDCRGRGCSDGKCNPPPSPKPEAPPQPVLKTNPVATGETNKEGKAYFVTTLKTGVVTVEIKHGQREEQRVLLDLSRVHQPGQPIQINIPLTPPSFRLLPFWRFFQPVYASDLSGNQEIIVSLFEDKNKNGIQEPNEPNIKDEGVEITISEVATDGQIYTLIEGWNLISLAVVPSVANTASKLLAEIARQGGYVTTVSRFENGQWEEYIQRGDQKFGHDFPLEPGRGYFLRNHQKVTFILQGQPITQNLPLNLKNGWSVIGIPSPTQELTAGKLLDEINQIDKTLPENATLVSRWESGLWETFVKRIYSPENIQEYGNNFPIEKTRGYAVKIERGVKFTP